MSKEVKLGYLSFMMPEYIYIPFDNKESLKIPKSKNIYCGSYLGSNIDNENIFSTVSGRIIGVKSLMTTTGLNNVLIIENDFRDKRQKIIGSKKDLLNYKVNEAEELLKYYNTDRNFNNKKYLIINISYDKKSDLSNNYLINKNVHKFLEAADAIQSIFKLIKVIFVINSKDHFLRESLSKYIGTYTDFSIFITKENIKDEVLAKSIYGKKCNECVVYNFLELFEVYNTLKNNKVLTEKYITVFGHHIETKVLYTKIGVSIEDILSVLRIKTIAKKVSLITKDTEINIERNEAVVTKDVIAIKII